MDSLGGSSQSSSSPTPLTPEQSTLITLQRQLAQQQLKNVQAVEPYNAALLSQSVQQLNAQNQYQTALNAAITPEQQAQAAADEFKQSQALGPIQLQLAQMQLDALKNGGQATDAQKQQIADATNAAITAGSGDIDTQTQRGIGMISDELANSRGLRLSDAPIGQEAALLVRAAGDQKSSLINNLRANQANATLNFPLASQQVQSTASSALSNSNQAFTQFQDQLRQQAANNRLALTGPATTTGIGLGNISPAGAAFVAGQGNNSSSSSSNGIFGSSGVGGLFSGAAAVGGLF